MRKLGAIFLVVGVAALAWMIYRTGPRDLWNGLQLIGWGLAGGFALHATALALDSLTLRACVAGKKKPPAFHLMRTSMTGYAINQATPLGKAGEVIKFGMLEQVMSKEDAAAALVAQNVIMFIVNCFLVALAPTIAALAIGAPGRSIAIFAAVGGVFLLLGAVAAAFLLFGVGPWPFALLRRLRIKKARVDRWEKRFDAAEEQWKKAARDPVSMGVAFGSGIASRLCSVGESALYFGLAGGDHVIAAGFLGLAGGVATGLVLFFVPFQAGTAEGSAYAIFGMAGLSGASGVVVELARKARLILFIAIGVALLGFTTAKDQVGAKKQPKGEPEKGDPKKGEPRKGEPRTGEPRTG